MGVGGRKVLLLTHGLSEALVLSARNIPHVDVLPYQEASAYDVLWAEVVIVEEAALSGEPAVPFVRPFVPGAEDRARGEDRAPRQGRKPPRRRKPKAGSPRRRRRRPAAQGEGRQEPRSPRSEEVGQGRRRARPPEPAPKKKKGGK